MPRKARSLRERFMEKLPADLHPDECWEWQAACDNYGYGRIGAGGPQGRMLHANRVSWELFNEEKIPEGMYALHHCDNPRCVNPSHLYVGTPADNMRDKVDRGRDRSPRGESHPRATVPDNLVREAAALVKSGLTYKAATHILCSRGYACSQASVWKWLNGKFRQSAFNQSQENVALPDTPSVPTCEVDQVESLQGKGEQLCLFTT